MGQFIQMLQDNTLLSAVIRLLLSAVLGGLIGTERAARGRAAGMRTHILVCIGAAMTALVGLYATDTMGLDSDPLRVSAQVISGIGFLGGGMILVRGRTHITGLTTAAGLWTTAAIGLAMGIGFYSAALVGTALVLVTNIVLPPLERGKKLTRDVLYAELDDAQAVNGFLDHSKAAYEIEVVRVMAARSGLAGPPQNRGDLRGDPRSAPCGLCHGAELLTRHFSPFPQITESRKALFFRYRDFP